MQDEIVQKRGMSLHFGSAYFWPSGHWRWQWNTQIFGFLTSWNGEFLPCLRECAATWYHLIKIISGASRGQFWHQLVMFFVRPKDEEEKIRGQVTGVRFLETWLVIFCQILFPQRCTSKTLGVQAVTNCLKDLLLDCKDEGRCYMLSMQVLSFLGGCKIHSNAAQLLLFSVPFGLRKLFGYQVCQRTTSPFGTAQGHRRSPWRVCCMLPVPGRPSMKQISAVVAL